MFRILAIFAMMYQCIVALPTSDSGCCVNHSQKSKYPTFIANYDCSQLDNFGRTQCNNIFSGETCKWKSLKKCKPIELKKCNRIPKYEMHYDKVIDVGRCTGKCKEDGSRCSPSKYVIKEIEKVAIIDSDIAPNQKKIRIIEECDCDNCAAVEYPELIEIPKGKCVGNCNQNQKNKICVAGTDDNFSSTNNLENSSPSTLLLSGILSQCSAGVQSGFDIFANDRCFGHTFTNCLMKGECPLKRANLYICIQAAPVSLTNTDSIILGVNGVGLWSQNLGILNGGGWNPGNTMCLDLDLGNLPGGVSILNTIDSVGHLDVVVQDDSAVDFARLNIQYDKCMDCIPSKSTMNTLYTQNGVSEFQHTTDCDCVNSKKCHREEHLQTFYPGTMYEQTYDVGQCIGTCDKGFKCTANDDNKIIKIKTPHGIKVITLINSCECIQLKWNGNAYKE
jgi:hypothetical protein